MKKLSESLHDLADHAANAEQKVAAAEKQTGDKVDATIATAKADAKARQDKFKADVAKAKATSAADWDKLVADHNQRIANIKSGIEAKKKDLDRNRASRRADDAEYNAAVAIDFALMAIDEAEVSTLEAIDARAYAQSLA